MKNLRRAGRLVAFLFVPCALFASPPVLDDAPDQAPQALRFVPEWSVGGEGSDILFGMVNDVLEGRDGELYVLDSQLGHVEVFSPGGDHRRTIGRRGEGPGEVRGPQSLVPLDGGRIGILDLFPAKLVVITPDGEPAGSVTIGGEGTERKGFSAAFRAARGGGTLIVGAQRSFPVDVGQGRTQYLARLDESGAELVRYRESSTVVDFVAPVFVERELMPAFVLANAVDAQGQVYAARARDEYAIEVFAADGEPLRVIERPFERLRRDAAATRRINALVDAWLEGFPLEVDRELDRYEPVVTDLHVDDDGVLWVLHARSGHEQRDGVFLTYDNFGSDGRWLREVSIEAEGDPARDGILFLRDGRALLIRGYVLARWAARGARNVDFGDDGPASDMEIVCGRLVPAV